MLTPNSMLYIINNQTYKLSIQRGGSAIQKNDTFAGHLFDISQTCHFCKWCNRSFEYILVTLNACNFACGRHAKSNEVSIDVMHLYMLLNLLPIFKGLRIFLS